MTFRKCLGKKGEGHGVGMNCGSSLESDKRLIFAPLQEERVLLIIVSGRACVLGMTWSGNDDGVGICLGRGLWHNCSRSEWIIDRMTRGNERKSHRQHCALTWFPALCFRRR